MMERIQSIVSTYRNNWKTRTGVMIFIILAWLSILYPTDSLPGPYIVCALVGIIGCAENARQERTTSGQKNSCGIVFAALFSFAVYFANYRLFIPIRRHFIKSGIFLAAGYFIGWHILKMTTRMETLKSTSLSNGKENLSKRWFLFPFLGISFIYMMTLFFCYRPGFLSPDSISQISQIVNGAYSNHHPFWHTMIIKAVMGMGQLIFQDINHAVTVYSVFQILSMAAIFAYICMTMYQAGIRNGWIVLTAIVYAVIPYHTLYSKTMWKDVLFGGTVALFVCALYRFIKEIGSKTLNYCFLIIGAMGSCLLRSNGLAAFIATFVLLAIVLRKSEKKMLVMLLAIIFVAFVMKHPVLKALGVSQPDTAEYLSIPEQQIAKLIVKEVPLEEDELYQIEQIMDIESVKSSYKAFISDPVKNIIKRTNLAYLNEHKWNYFLLWLRLGFRYPEYYFQAWIDQTRGYWNGGYDYWIVSTGIVSNNFGIKASSQNNIISRIAKSWVRQFFKNPFFQVFYSIGFHVWIVALCGFVLLIKKRKEGLICVLPLAVILSFLISTLVFSEFRYAYAIFTAFPFIAFTAFCTSQKH